MKFKLLLIATFLVCFSAKAQELTDENLMGEWKVVNVDRPNSDKIPDKKEALKVFQDFYLKSTFIFDKYNYFNMEQEGLPDERLMQLLLLNYQKWEIQKDKIFIGTDVDKYFSMHITYQEADGKAYFILPMIRLEMEKIKNYESSKAKASEPKTAGVDYVIPEIFDEEKDENLIIDFNLIENPPLAVNCKPKWDVEKRKQCTNEFIQQQVVKELNTDLPAELGLTGRVRIITEFVIDKNGKVIDVTAEGTHRKMNQNVVDAVKLLPDFTPGTKDEKPVKVSYRLILSFVVDDLKKAG